MKKMLRNKEGFTLVELLAVIVVLAIIILVAMPAVMSAMDKARKNSLVNEANEIVKIAQSAYAEESMSASVVGGTAYCYSLNWLKTNGFLEKNLDNYSGAILLYVEDGVTKTHVYLDNGMYYFEGAKIDKDGSEVNADSSNLKKGDGSDTNLNKCKNSSGSYPTGFGGSDQPSVVLRG